MCVCGWSLQRLTAREAFQEALEELELHEREQARRLEKERERKQQQELYRVCSDSFFAFIAK